MATTLLRARPRIEEAGRFQILEELGRGPFTRVVKALDSRERSVVALKILRAAHRGDEELRARLVREGGSLARIHHPCVMPVREVVTRPEPFYAMPLVEGSLLATYRRRGPAPLRALRVLGVDLADGLGAIHAVGLVHRDLRPENVFVVKGHPLIFDLGIAKDLATLDELTRASFAPRNPEYASPEALRGEKVTAQSDLHALGVILLELALGTNPFACEDPIETTERQLSMNPPRLDDLRPDLPRGFADLVSELLEKDAARRPQSAWTVSHRVRAILGD